MVLLAKSFSTRKLRGLMQQTIIMSILIQSRTVRATCTVLAAVLIFALEGAVK